MSRVRWVRFVAAAFAATTVLGACSSGSDSSESSDESARTKNSVLGLTEPAAVVLYTAYNSSTVPTFYTASLASGGTISSTDLFTDTSGAQTAVTGMSFDSATRTIYWITQEGSTAHVRSRQLDSGVTNTLYSLASTIPGSLGFDPVNSRLYWNGTQSATGKTWIGDLSSSPATNPVAYEYRVFSTAEDRIYGFAGINLFATVMSPHSRFQLTSGVGADSYAVIADETNSQVYYTTGYNTTTQIKKVDMSGSGTVTDYVTPSSAATQLAMKSNGSLVWANGVVAARTPPTGNSTINIVDPEDTLTSLVFTPSPAAKITTMWIIEVPQTDVDPTVSGDGVIGSDYVCNDASWASDLTAQKLSRAPEPGRNYSWYLNGSLISGETGDTYTSTAPGNLKCAVEATNLAGSTIAESPEVTVIDPAATTTTSSPASSSGGATDTTPASPGGSSTSAGSTPAAQVTYPTIKVKWKYMASTKTLQGTFKKVTGARTYSMSISGATKKTVKCSVKKSTVTCMYKLKKGSNSIVVNAKNSAKVIVGQKVASKTVR